MTPRHTDVNPPYEQSRAAYGLTMKHVTYADKSLLVGDEAADTLLEYARLVAENHGVETVTLRSVGADGDEVETSFLLTTSSDLLIQSHNSDQTEPDNTDAIARMRARIEEMTRPAYAEPDGPLPAAVLDDVIDSL
jgi:hypothetical protein